LPTELVAGETVSFEVSDLDLTSLGSPANTELGVLVVPADLEDLDDVLEPLTVVDVVDGAATVTFTVPEDVDGGEYILGMVATPTLTVIQFPVLVTADDRSGPGEPTPTPTDSQSPTPKPTQPGGGGSLPSTGSDLGV